MISRVADHCFWMGRYLERAEATARLLFVTRHYMSLDAGLTPRQCWLPVLIATGEEADFTSRYGEKGADDGEAVQHHMTWDERNFSSIANCVSAARENARSIREVISSELWETVNELHLWFASPLARAEYQHERYGFYRKVRQACQLAAGYRRSTMLHDEPVNFMWLGVLLERVSQTARVVDVHHHALSLIEKTDQVVETALWLSLLRACSGFEPFIKVHQGKVTGDAVAAFLIFEGRFPKSVVYGVRGALSRFVEIRPPAEGELPGQETYERLRALDAWLAGGARTHLPQDFHGVLTRVVDETASICDALAREMLGAQPASSQESSQ